MDASGGEVVAVQEFAARRAGSPEHDLLVTPLLRLVKATDKRGNHMARLQVIVVAGTVDSGWNRAQEAGRVLPVIGPAKLGPRDLGDAIRAVRWLKRAGHERALADGLRGITRIHARRTEEQQRF